ncbi:LuxR C-terminal-related transcriptional regulator [Gordonia aquimaris]|uniref:LuxR C-terminal-related transcriptional regulator n=1 Tax=Gordonia aquimaris TaxID=2984863 RepID=A0A9X3I6I6_9ACTN|nr:LuxR C-terminal-related transcriptional regulator [Gordonia aquimaris]MCX2966867.1 LuxR C-terminal-related transcriptional regulator [Gordonia aquimaris]
MTALIDQYPDSAISTVGEAPHIAVIAEHDLFDAALVALVEKLGGRPGLIDLDAPRLPAAGPTPSVALVRAANRAERVRRDVQLRSARILVIDVRAGSTGAVRTVDQLRAFMPSAVASSTAPRALSRVHVTARELEVLTTYLTGATITETARHHFLAESTVRTHYRRVSDRYTDAGRSIGNRVRLLLALVADGYIEPSNLLHAADANPPTPEHEATPTVPVCRGVRLVHSGGLGRDHHASTVGTEVKITRRSGSRAAAISR